MHSVHVMLRTRTFCMDDFMFRALIQLCIRDRERERGITACNCFVCYSSVASLVEQ